MVLECVEIVRNPVTFSYFTHCTISNFIVPFQVDCAMKTYLSYDQNDPNNKYPFSAEILNQINPVNAAPHVLKLCKHNIVTLKVNLDPIQGLCHGTQLDVIDLQQHVIATIPTTSKKKKIIYIPRIKFHIIKKSNSPIRFFRFQFPLEPAFMLSINKMQGRTNGTTLCTARFPKPTIIQTQLTHLQQDFQRMSITTERWMLPFSKETTKKYC